MEDGAWIGVIGALGGVVATGLIGLATAALNHRWQSDTRKRERAERLAESRATLRQDAYIRFLAAADAVASYAAVLHPQPGTGPAKDANEALDRLRKLRTGGDAHFTEYARAEIEVALLGGSDVRDALEEFDQWMTDQIVAALATENILDAEVFFDQAEKTKLLIEAMRQEQEIDVLVRGDLG